MDQPEKVAHGREGYYFGESGEIELGEWNRAIGKALVRFGKIADPVPVPYTKEEVAKYWGGVGPTFSSHKRRCAN